MYCTANECFLSSALGELLCVIIVLDDPPLRKMINRIIKIDFSSLGESSLSEYDNGFSGTVLWTYATGSSVHSVSISSDGQYIVVGNDGNKVYLFDSSSSIPLWSYTTNGWVRSIAISSDGNYIVAGDLAGGVYLFHHSSSTPLWMYSSNNAIQEISISLDGQYIVATDGTGSIGRIYLFERY